MSQMPSADADMNQIDFLNDLPAFGRADTWLQIWNPVKGKPRLY